jgi:RimJ/RimL family protein N-acetyltransferase
LEAKAQGIRCPLVVFDKKSGEYVGSSSFYDINQANLRIAIGYTFYGPKHQKSGINRNAKILMLNYCFNELAARRVEFHLN